jgi:anthranilate synthase/aminodeoxychorismate synthase-like glutamine amidotransferase
MILVIDNYDSFVYNLARYVNLAGGQTRIIRNDSLDIPAIRALRPDAIIISPGPCTPDDAGVSIAAARELGADIPVLGVCLGHQAMAQAFGGRTIRAQRPMHGKASAVLHDGQGIFKGLPSPFMAGRYHSLVVDIEKAKDLEVNARTDDGVIMAMRHKVHPVYGVQFHPESVLTQHGQTMIQNFLNIVSEFHARPLNRQAA